MDDSDIRDSARDFFAEIIHTVCQDILEDLDSRGVCDRSSAEGVIQDVAKKWVNEGFKIKKRPAPRKAPQKKSAKEEYVPIQESYYYLSTLKFREGLFPLFDSNLGSFVASFSPKDGLYYPLEQAHERILASRSLPVDAANKW